MDETTLRWRGRIGSLKGGAVVVLIAAAVVLYLGIGNLTTARANPTEPQPKALSELVGGTVGTDSYVSISGYAVYEMGYEKVEEDSGRTTESDYLLIDYELGYVVVVKADTARVDDRTEGWVTVSGMTEYPPTDLRELMENDLPNWIDEGFDGTAQLYVKEGAKPPSESTALAMAVGGGVAILMSALVFFFPSVVFAPMAVLPGVVTNPDQLKLGVKATGRFLRLKRLQPAIEIGRGAMKFSNVVANIVSLQDRRILI